MSYNITLNSSMRSNLLFLRNISTQMSRTQNILSTGKKINNAIDNATSYYQARSLTNRVNDLNNLLDSMSQGIQTIQTATQGLDSVYKYLEQAKSLANQALLQNNNILKPDKPKNEIKNIIFTNLKATGTTYQDYIDEGYREITASMDASQIQDLLVEGAKIILKEDITLSEGLDISVNNVTIFGNGKTLTVNKDNTSAITVKGKDVIADIKGLNIVVNGNNAIGIKAIESGTIIIDKLDNITAYGDKASNYYYRDENFFKGKEYTQAIYNQLKSAGSVSGTATEYAMNYKATGIANNDENFGQGKWYIGAIGEWTDLYGYDYADIVGANDNIGAHSENINKINKTLDEVENATNMKDKWYWTSSEDNSTYSWRLHTGDNGRSYDRKRNLNNIRCFTNVENCYNPVEITGPQIGDIMYSDKTWSSADDYSKYKDAGKVAVGVVFDIDTINGDVKIVALNDASSSKVQMGGYGYNFTNVPNYGSPEGFVKDLKNTGEIIVTHIDTPLINDSNNEDEIIVPDDSNTNDNGIIINTHTYLQQFNNYLNEIDKLIYDSSYQGINLLTGEELTVTFNEGRTHKLSIKGKDMRLEKIGIKSREWQTTDDVYLSINEISGAINKIRNFQAELGNNLSIIQTRQSFTEALSNVLQTGADELVLADMNEASAEYLMMQTRQQLAINSLALASQSASSILSLF